MKICFFIGKLDSGGTERQLAQLATGLASKSYNVTVITIFPGGENWDRIKNYKKIDLVSLYDIRSKIKLIRIFQVIASVWFLRKEIKTRHRCVVYSMLYLANIIAWMSMLYTKNSLLIWGIRMSDVSGFWMEELPYRLCKMFSTFVSYAVSNSWKGKKIHQKQGFKCSNWEVIPNGTDVKKFKPDVEARLKIRNEWGVGENKKLIGMVARLNVIKDHENLLKAIVKFIKFRKDVIFVCVGDGSSSYFDKLIKKSQEFGIDEFLIWAGHRKDVSAIYNAFDLATLSSLSEGSPNVISEAMSCGVLCVSTNVGDAAEIMGNFGVVVPARNPEALADAWVEMLERSENEPQLSSQAREYIIKNYNSELALSRTIDFLNSILSPLQRII